MKMKVVSSQTPHRPTTYDPQPQSDTQYLTPTGVARRWSYHPESVRRILREQRLASIINGRRRLIPVSEVLRIEAAGYVAAKG